MEIKATLRRPYSDRQRVDFIVENNYKYGYEIRETGEALEAWGLTSEEELQQVKENKYQEALEKANYFLNNEALFELEENVHIEATKENMNTMATAAIAIEKGLMESQSWTSKEDTLVELNEEECLTISMGIGMIQSEIWNNQFLAYKELIDEAETVEAVKAIAIVYLLEAPESEEVVEE